MKAIYRNRDGLTSCCKALTTYSIATGDPVECCKVCWEEVTHPRYRSGPGREMVFDPLHKISRPRYF
jgi:hypothetical protein